MKSLLPFACFLLIVSACAPSDRSEIREPEAVSPSAGEILTADTPRTTVDGNGFVAPAEWSIRTRGPAVILTAPEGDSHIALVDVAAQDADTAVAAAWSAYDADAEWPLERASDRPVRDGWEQIRGYRYDTSSANDLRGVSAQARRRGDRWTVAIYDMNDAVGDKRDAQIDLIYGRLLPKGYRRETFAGRTAHKLDEARLDALRKFVEDARQQFEVPGIALGIVQDGKVVTAEGFGVRELGKAEKVDANTKFMIASNTKGLTTLMMAKLIDAGTFTWDTPATEVLPSFELGDADTTRKLLIKHLVCACTGLPRQDMEWIFQSEGGTPESVLATLATMKPTSELGELYQYSNTMVAAAGFAGAYAFQPQQELGAAYDAAMQALVFDPLEMTSTTFDFARAQRGNYAVPHAQDFDGKTVTTRMDFNYTAIPSRPDGGAWSNVNDMLRYVQMELSNGLLPGGTRYIGEAPLLARRAQQVSRGDDRGYGLGLKIDRTSGTSMLHHGGSMLGYISDMLWLPEHNVGAVILTNEDNGSVSLRSLFRRRFLEVLFDGEPQAVANLPVQSRRKKESITDDRQGLTVPADPASVAKLAARYQSAALGEIEVSQAGTTLWFDFGDWKSEMASRTDDGGTTSFVTVAPGLIGFEFEVAGKENERSLVLRDAQHEYVFVEAQ